MWVDLNKFEHSNEMNLFEGQWPLNWKNDADVILIFCAVIEFRSVTVILLMTTLPKFTHRMNSSALLLL